MSELEDHLRRLHAEGGLTRLSISRVGEGRYQANMQIDGNAFNHAVENDPIDALLVATGAISQIDMNRRKYTLKQDAFGELLG